MELDDMGFRISLSLLGLTRVLAAAVMFLSAPAWAQTPSRDFVEEVNSKLNAVPKEKRSELIVMPKLLKLASPPAEVRSVERAQLILTTSPGWPDASAWATAQTQKDLLKAIEDVTKE